MSDNLLTEQLHKKWEPVLEHGDYAPIKDNYRKSVTAVLLENQQQALQEAAPTNALGGSMTPNGLESEGSIKGFDPVLISLVRRAMPNMIAYDVCGVQPMTGPTGLIFAMRSRHGAQNGAEAFYNEPGFSAGSTLQGGITAQREYTDDPLSGQFAGNATRTGKDYHVSEGDLTSVAEGKSPAEMAFSIERIAVEAKTRSLQAKYSTELAQDLKAVHGLDAEAELANILSTEILAEINREVIRNLNLTAVLGCSQGDLNIAGGGVTLDGIGASNGFAGNKRGVYDLLLDSDGRWSAEKFRGLMFQIERECNTIAKETRRGKGNFIICSSDVASALSMSGMLDSSPAFANLEVDDTGNTFVGTLNGRLKVYIDPYATANYVNVGYRGSSQYDAGVFYCPYVPLQMARAVDSSTYQPQIAFKTRYGMVANPFSKGASAPSTSFDNGQTPLEERVNVYYRIFRVDDLHGINANATAAG